MSGAPDYDSIVANDVQRRAVGNLSDGATVPPGTAVAAMNGAAASGVPASVAMHAPDVPNDVALFHDNTAILKTSPEVRSLVASSPAAAAATKDDFSSLSGIANTVNRWNDTANADFAAPGASALHGLLRDVPRWLSDEKSGTSSPLSMIPGFSPQDQKLGSVLADLAGVALSPFSGAIYAAARPFSYIPLPTVQNGKITGNASQADAQSNVANIISTALLGASPAGGLAGAGAEAGGLARGGQRLLTGPRGPAPAAPVYTQAVNPGLDQSILSRFTDTPPPGVNPADSIIHSSVAEIDAHNVGMMQDAVAQSKTLGRSPDLMKTYLEDHTAASGQMVSVPGESITKLWQQGHMVFQDQAAQILDSVRNGGDVKVPMSQYLTETSGQPFAEELNAATRFRETGVSQDEAKTLPTEPRVEITNDQFRVRPEANLVPGNAAADQAFGLTGHITPEGDFRVNVAMLPEEAQGKGLGMQLYESAIAQASKRGGTLMSDSSVSTSAQHVWEGLQRRGYDVVKNPAAVANERGNLETPDESPVYRIRKPDEEGSIFNQSAPMLPDQTGSPAGTAQQFTPNGLRYVVKPETTDLAEIEKMLPTAEKYGGKYAMGRAKTAFQFRTPEARDAFLNELKNPEAEQNVEAREPFTPEIPEDLKEDAPRIQAIAARAEDAVTRVFKETALDQLFSEPKATGLTKGQFERFAERVDEARNDTIQHMLEKTFKQIRRERTPEWKAAVDLYKEEGTGLIEAQPNVQAYRALKDPLFKIDSEKAAELYPDLPLPSTLTKRGGLLPDEAAELTGHSSGSALVQDLYHLHEAVAAVGGTLNDYVKNRVQAYSEAKARDMLGYDISPDAMLNDAREAMTEPAIENLLTADLKELADNAGVPFDRKMVEARAEDMFSRLTIKEASTPKQFAETMRRLGNKAEASLTDERPIKAFETKQQQFLQYLMMRQAFKFQREYRSGMNALTSLARKPIVKGMDQATRNQLRAIVKSLGIPVKNGKYESVEAALKGQSLDQFTAALEAQGYNPVHGAIPTIPTQGSLSDINVDDFRGLMDTVKSLSTLGRDMQKAFLNGKAQELSNIVGGVKDNATRLVGRQFTAGELQRLRGTVEGTVKAAMRGLGSANSRPETFLYWLDGETNGPLMKYMVGELQNGKYYKTDLIQEIGKSFKDFVATQPKGWQNSLEDAVDVPELKYSKDASGQPINWLSTRGNVIMMATHFGTKSNFTKLTEGFGWDPQTVRDVANNVLSEADWKYVQHILDVHKGLLPKIQQLYRATAGLAMDTVEATPIPTPYGELAGGYRTLTYDWNSIEEKEDEEGNIVPGEDPTSMKNSELFGHGYQMATPPNRHTLKRTQFSGPLNLEHSVLPLEFESIIHDLAYRMPLLQAAKLLRQNSIRQSIRETLGPEYLSALNKWLQDIAGEARYDQTSLKKGAALVRGIRRRFTTVQIGYNLTTLLKHGGIAMAHVSGEVGAAEFVKASGDLWKSEELRAWVDEQSGEVRGAMMNLDRDVREAVSDLFRKQGFVENYQYHAFTAFAFVKRLEATSTWLAKYRNLTNKDGLPHEDAVALANKAVRDTQGAASVVDLAAFYRGGNDFWGEVGKLSNMFTGFENTTSNRAWTMIRRSLRPQAQIGGGGNGKPPGGVLGYEDRGDAGARRDFQKNLGDFLAYFVYAALVATLVDEVTGGRLHKGAKGAAEFATQFMENTLKGALGGSFPLGSYIADLPQQIARHSKDFGSKTALESMFGSSVQTATNAWMAANPKQRHKIEDRWLQDAITTVGYWTNMPVKPLAKAGQFLWDKSQGHVKDKSYGEFFRGLAFGPTTQEAKKPSDR